MWNIRASINIIHFRRYSWCPNYMCCLLSQSLQTSGVWRCTIWYTRIVSAAHLTKIFGTTSWITMILIHLHKKPQITQKQHKQTKWRVNMWENRNKSSKHKNLLAFLPIICKVAHSWMLNNASQLCWKHNALYKCGESSHNHNNSFYVVKFYCNMFRLIYNEPSLH